MNEAFQTKFRNCQALQGKIKNQYLLVQTQQDQKVILEKKLSTALKNYYRNLVHMDRASWLSKAHARTLLEDEGFDNCYIFIKDIILTLSKDYHLMFLILSHHNNWSKMEIFTGIAKVIVDSMYQNVVDDQICHKDILKLLHLILQSIVQEASSPFALTFSQNTLFIHILRVFLDKTEYASYATDIVKGALLELAKLDRLINFTLLEEDDVKSVHKIGSKKFDSPTKKNVHSKSFYEHEKKITKSAFYSEALKKKDDKIRTSTLIRTKNKNCVSNDLLHFLGIDDSISFPVFRIGKGEKKEQEKNDEQFNLLLNRNLNQHSTVDIPLVKNLIFIFFGELFKRLYCMPMMIRILCRLLFEILMKKFSNRHLCLSTVSHFVIKFWIGSALRFQDHLIQSGKISDYTQENSTLLQSIIFCIINNDTSKCPYQFLHHLNLIMGNLRISLTNYMNELINVAVPSFQQDKADYCFIRNYSVCLSVADVSRLLQMLRYSRNILEVKYEKIIKKLDKIDEMSKGTQIFNKKKDKVTKKEYLPEFAFVLFSELTLPEDVSFDYNKFYSNSFKKDKIKNVIRHVLLNIQDLDGFDDLPQGSTTLKCLFEHILKSHQECYGLNSLDTIPVEIKIQYLLTLTRGKNIQQYLQIMNNEVNERLQVLHRVWDKTKECYLKAITSVIEQNKKISYSEIFYKEETMKRKLDQFMKKQKIHVCITSPKTRQKQVVIKTNLMKEMMEEEKDKIWIQNQSKCIHTALNLEYIKSLTGDVGGSKNKFQSHFSTASKFADIFCSLPQVKERGMSGQDNIGIKEALQNFMTFLVDLIKSNEEYEILSENLEWLEQHLEQRITKRIYEKLYPRMPTYNDLGFYFRLKTLEWITYEHLKINPVMQVEGMWDIAAKNIKQIDKLKTASQKLNSILQCSNIITRSYSLISLDDKPITADQIFPIVVYVLIKAAPRRLISNMNFISMFANRNRLASRNGYFFTQLNSVIQYCDNLNHSSLNMDMLDYNLKIYGKEIQYGIYFLMRRRKEEPTTISDKIEYLKKLYFEKSPEKQQEQPLS